jgi:DNA-binding MarR family transcriptional regulator
MVGLSACILARVSLRDARADRSTPSDAELAAGVESLLANLWWRISCETPSDISRTSASTLRCLLEDGPQRITALAAREPVAQPTMSMIVKRLEQRGLVERAVDPGDARATLVAITPAGVETLSMRAELRSRWFASRLAGLEQDDRRTIMAAVEILLDTLN